MEQHTGVPHVRGLPWLGSGLALARAPTRFFVACYRRHGALFELTLVGRRYTVLAGAEAASFMNSREGRSALSSGPVWAGFEKEYHAERSIMGQDGDGHRELREILRVGYGREAIAGRYGELVALTDAAIAREFPPGRRLRVLPALQRLVLKQLGTLLTGSAPLDYVDDIRIFTEYVLNVRLTQQRPALYLRFPAFRRAKARVFELADSMARAWQKQYPEGLGRAPTNLTDAVMHAHTTCPMAMPRADLTQSLIGPYAAGLDTVVNTVAMVLYEVLRRPELHAEIVREVDALFAAPLVESELFRPIPTLQGAIMETMRLHPIAVVQMRVAARDFSFAGRTVRAGTQLMMATSVPHFLPEHFPDPERFDVRRYDAGRSEHLAPGVYSPFGRGIHTCLGKGIAEVQLALTCARLFHRLDLALVHPDRPLKKRMAPVPGPAPSFELLVRGLRR